MSLLETLRHLASAALLLGGSALMLLAAVGLLRFPDVFCRGHAQTKATTLGILSVLGGCWLLLGWQGTWPLAAAFLAQLLTIPVSGHMIAHLALRKRVPRWRRREAALHKGFKGPKPWT